MVLILDLLFVVYSFPGMILWKVESSPEKRVRYRVSFFLIVFVHQAHEASCKTSKYKLIYNTKDMSTYICFMDICFCARSACNEMIEIDT